MDWKKNESSNLWAGHCCLEYAEWTDVQYLSCPLYSLAFYPIILVLSILQDCCTFLYFSAIDWHLNWILFNYLVDMVRYR